MPQRKKTRRPARAKPSLDFSAPVLDVLIGCDTAGVLPVRITFQGTPSATPPWNSPATAFKADSAASNLVLKLQKDGDQVETAIGDFTAVDAFNIEPDPFAWNPTGAWATFYQSAYPDSPVYLEELGVWVDPNKKYPVYERS
jgi:hypothetical protein